MAGDDPGMAEGGSMTWIPVGERLPRAGTGSLVARRWFNIFNGKYEGEVLIAWLVDGLWRFSGSADVPPLDDVTHWQPLPPLPGADQ